MFLQWDCKKDMVLHMTQEGRLPSGRQDRRKARTRVAVMEAAQRLFVQRGYHASTLEAIADAADVAVRSVYVHFGDKAGLYSALLDEALELDKRYCDEGWEAGDGPVGRLFGLAEGYLRFCRDHPGLFRIFRFPPSDAADAGGLEAVRGRVAARVQSEIARMAGALSEAVECGHVRSVPAEATATFLWAAWDGVLVSSLQPDHLNLTDTGFDAVLDQARDVLAAGLLVPPD